MNISKTFICSPYRGVDIEKNLEVAKNLCRITAYKGQLPIAPHLIFTAFLHDNVELERNMGILFGIELMKECELIIKPQWLSLSMGMIKELDYNHEHLQLEIYTMSEKEYLHELKTIESVGG